MVEPRKVHLRMVIPSAPWTRAMEDGAVRVEGLSWECISDIGDAPARFIATEKADVGENGVRRLLLDHLKGSPPVAIPVFFGREHMQRNILVREDSALSHPRDLAGKRIGSRLTIVSGTSAGVLMMLEQAYGLDLRGIEWRMGDGVLPVNRLGLNLGPGPATDAEVFELLVRGELDAVVVTGGPRYWSLFGGDKIDEEIRSHPVRPLIADPATIADAYRRTALYPITDLAVVREGLGAADLDVPARLVEAFSRSNAVASRYRGADEEALAQREIELLGEDPHLYGLGANPRRNLAAFIDFLYRLGAIERFVEREALFVPMK